MENHPNFWENLKNFTAELKQRLLKTLLDLKMSW